MQTCRFCQSLKNEDQMVKYGVRHYAHFECYLDAGKKLDALHAWQIYQFPHRLLKARGLVPHVEALLREKNARDAGLPMRNRPRCT